ncbi:hypothetical protein GQX73_g10033 [Xylaria multiplex]|uniref:PinX1-related protein 1 n=1 Tax=Xylaria multiplex TaxID=323545 RepID=A0A7C8ITK1_9PEZI|nr:hypothetical protein GQX73_g10033 [Xylaria multiplex]
MGLSGPRNRRKLDYDPNNTRWTRDETTFGQKILRSQGWEPGKYLGAQDTAHAQLHSAASLAPIKINLKDDTLGLGAKIRQKQSDECTGLDVFKDLLGRLNGKSEETIEKQRQVRSEIKTSLFVERRYGPMRFVSGGLLVGDQRMEELVDKKPESTPVKDESTSEASEVESAKKEKKEKKEKKSKKRKASESEDSDTSDSKRGKKQKKCPKGDEELNIVDAEADKSTKKKKDKKEKKLKRSKRALEEEKDVEPVEPEVKRKKSKKSKDTSQQESLSNSAETSEDGASEKARKKEKKRQKKRKQADSAEASAATETIESSTATPQDSGTSTPTSTLASHALSARHRARSRNIASKRLAISNMQALNQIFMVKPV